MSNTRMFNSGKAKPRGPRKSAGYVIVASLLAVLASVLLVATSTFAGAISRAANWGLGVPGTGNPTATPNSTTLPTGSMATFTNAEVRNFITPTNPACGSGLLGPSPTCNQQAIDYDASFWPIILFGLNQLFSPTWNQSVASGVTNLGNQLALDYKMDPTGNFYLTGYSQGGTVLSYFKNNYPSTGGLPPTSQVTFVMAANPNRPNGGLFERFGIFNLPIYIPILDTTVGIPASTDKGIKTTDIVIQYDGVSDFPEYPINLLADANGVAGLFFIHPTYVYPNGAIDPTTGKPVGHPTEHPYGYTEAAFTAAVAAAQQAADNNQCGTAGSNCQKFGDTTYITLPTDKLPLLAPLYYVGQQANIPLLTAFADLVNPAMKVLVETGFNRTSYGTPTNFQLIPFINPATFTVNFVTAVFQGISDAIGDLNGTRPPDPTIQDPFATAAGLLNGSGDSPAASSTPPAQLPSNALTPKTLTAKALSTSAPSTSGTPSVSATTPSTTSVSGSGGTTATGLSVTATATPATHTAAPETNTATSGTGATTSGTNTATSGTGATTIGTGTSSSINVTNGAKVTPSTNGGSGGTGATGGSGGTGETSAARGAGASGASGQSGTGGAGAHS